MRDGILLIDKPSEMTSFGVVARVRRVLTKKYNQKIKVGHTGTLDPFATGLMILVIGKECKNANLYSKLDKIYEATICLGKNSTTGDPEGELNDVSNIVPEKTEIERALKSFVGEISQRPPAFSAIKIDGQRAYKLARAGEKIEIPERKIKIYDINLIDYDYPSVKIKAHVSSGTYIRSLAEDIGSKLGTGAYCEQLRRVAIGDWNIDNAQKLVDFLSENENSAIFN